MTAPEQGYLCRRLVTTYGRFSTLADYSLSICVFEPVALKSAQLGVERRAITSHVARGLTQELSKAVT